MLVKSATNSLLSNATVGTNKGFDDNPPSRLELEVPILADADQISGGEQLCHFERRDPMSTADQAWKNGLTADRGSIK